jgi:hypothetical protein
MAVSWSVHTGRCKRTLESMHIGSCHMQHSEPYRSSSTAQTTSKTVHSKRLGHWRSQYLTAMPSASLQSGSTGNGGAWLKERASV